MPMLAHFADGSEAVERRRSARRSLQLDIAGALFPALFPALLAILFTDLFDSLSTFVGVAHATGLVDILPADCVGRSSIPVTTDQYTYLPPKISSVLLPTATGRVQVIPSVDDDTMLSPLVRMELPSAS